MNDSVKIVNRIFYMINKCIKNYSNLSCMTMSGNHDEKGRCFIEGVISINNFKSSLAPRIICSYKYEALSNEVFICLSYSTTDTELMEYNRYNTKSIEKLLNYIQFDVSFSKLLETTQNEKLEF